MVSFGKRTVMLPLSLAAVMAVGLPQAHAQGLFDKLFGGTGKSQPLKGDFPPPPQPKKKTPVAAVKISSPTYNNYKADSLVKVDFSALSAGPSTGSVSAAIPVSQDVSVEAESGAPVPIGATFSHALPGLSDYDLSAERDIAKALISFYSANPDFLWVTDGAVNASAREALRVLGESASFGLTPADYSVDVPPSGVASGNDGEHIKAFIRFEMALSARVLRYVHDAQDGRIDPNRISGYYDFPAKPLDLKIVLNTLAHTHEVRTYLESRHPQNPEYQALRVELEALQASAENEIVIDPKLLLKPGQTSAELPKLLTLISKDFDEETSAKFSDVMARLGSSEIYDPELVPVIEAAQKKAGLKADGVVGPATVAALAGGSKAERIAKVQYALEELRWLPSDLGSPRVFINQPAFTASYIDGGVEKLKTRVVIGRTTNQTSFFYDHIKQVDFHPYWGVPQSIIVNEMLPRLRNDPGYLDRSGYEVSDSSGKRIPSSAIDWSQYGGKVPFNVRQAPSEANALGELKILFPNKHAIYMHDTPQKAFFQRDARALSHGCVRLQDPRGMAAAVLGTSVDYIADKLKKGHSSENVTRSIPVYVAYFTAWPDTAGKVEYFPDVYDRDTRLQQALDITEAVRTPTT